VTLSTFSNRLWAFINPLLETFIQMFPPYLLKYKKLLIFNKIVLRQKFIAINTYLEKKE
jgi:hypothetical protein